MDEPVRVALARPMAVLPAGPGWWFEPKFDGVRAILIRDRKTVRLQSRSGRIVTSQWMDVAVAGMALRPGTVLDGELVIWSSGRLDFGAVQSRAASSPERARALAEQRPAHYVVWDCLQHPVHGDVRGLPYVERRAMLLDALSGVGPPIQAVPASDDIVTAREWYDSLRVVGIEGVVAKPARSTYRPSSRVWVKVRHAEPVDAAVVGYTGPPARPRALVVELPGGRSALSQRLTPQLSAAVAEHLSAETGARRMAQTADGERYAATEAGLLAEVLAGSTRHRVVTVMRIRQAEPDLESNT